MIRNYRDIGKPASVLMYTGAGKSQITVIEASAFQILLTVNVNGTEYVTEHKVSGILPMTMQSRLDSKLFTGVSGAGSATLSEIPFSSKISLHSDAYDPAQLKPYHSLADVIYNFAEYESLSLFKTRFKAKPITIKENGVIRSGGISVVTDRSTDVKALLSAIVRRLRYPASLMPSQSYLYECNMYFAPNQCFYCFSGSNIYRLPFDLNTFVFGEPVLIASDFGRVGFNQTCGTDLDGIVAARVNNSTMKVFDCYTETIQTFTLPNTLIYPDGMRMAWNGSKGVFQYTGYVEVFVSPRMYQYYGFTFNPYTGELIKNTGRGAGAGELIFIDDDVMIGSISTFLNNLIPGTTTAPTVQLTATNTTNFTNQPTLISEEGFYVNMVSTQFELGAFPSNYVAISDLPDIPVSIGDVVTVQYEYNIS